MTESEWIACDWPFDMLEHLHGKIDDKNFIPFSVACCRRIWPLLSDPRSRAVVDATEAAFLGNASWDAVQAAYEDWHRAYYDDTIEDHAGGSTNEAIESVCGIGSGHAAQVSQACRDSVGYADSERLRQTDAPQSAITAAWEAAELVEREAHCKLLRTMFEYVPSASGDSA